VSVGMPEETVVFHCLLYSVGDLSPVLELMPIHKTQFSFCGTIFILPGVSLLEFI